MVSFLIDTDVVSALRRPDKNPSVRKWLESNREQLIYLSVITIGELRRGIEMRRARELAAAALLEAWLEELKSTYDSHILPVGTSVAEAWGRLTATQRQNPADAMIAATALVHDLTVVTRNVRHFAGMSVRVLDPF